MLVQLNRQSNSLVRRRSGFETYYQLHTSESGEIRQTHQTQNLALLRACRFDSYLSHYQFGEIPKWSKGTDCKSVDYGLRRFESSFPLYRLDYCGIEQSGVFVGFITQRSWVQIPLPLLSRENIQVWLKDADCKSVVDWLRRFKSYFSHCRAYSSIGQSVGLIIR